MITYVIIGVTVVVSYICFGNHELFRKLAFIPYCSINFRSNPIGLYMQRNGTVSFRMVLFMQTGYIYS